MLQAASSDSSMSIGLGRRYAGLSVLSSLSLASRLFSGLTMGKKSRRQRTKKVGLKDAAANSPHGNLAPEKLRGLGNEVVDSQKYWTHDDERGRTCRLIDALAALQRRDAGPCTG